RHLVTDGTLGRVYLIMADETIAGYLVLTFGFSLEFHGRDAFIDEFFIREEFRSRGLGSAALKFIEDDCRKMGIEAVHLEVDHINARGQSLYRRWGYTDHRRFLLTKWV
ncbi:MAG: GNAT family N-acetyltransferase, partial [Rhizobacter sp.]|nr:GNAT family N-acetyltransferase [Chlorobiales bacterium]